MSTHNALCSGLEDNAYEEEEESMYIDQNTSVASHY